MERKYKNLEFGSKIWFQAMRGLLRAIKLYLNDPNVALIDLGLPFRNSHFRQPISELAVRFHVYQKFAGADFEIFARKHPQRVFDASRIGFEIDIIPVRYQLHWGGQEINEQTRFDNFSKILYGGIQIMSPGSMAWGTLGGKVRDCQTGQLMLLSNYHILAIDEFGSNICQPNRLQITQNNIPIASYVRNGLTQNIDAAVSSFNGNRICTNVQSGLGTVTGITFPKLGMKVIKSGAGSGITYGIISGIMGSTIRHWHGKRRLFSHLIQITTMTDDSMISTPGDSGAWWLEHRTHRVVGLHFGGSHRPNFALAFSMPAVFNALQIEYAPDPAFIPILNQKPLPFAQKYRTTHKDEENFYSNQSQTNRISLRRHRILLTFFIVFFTLCCFSAIFAFSISQNNSKAKIKKLEVNIKNFEIIFQIETTHRQKIEKILTILQLNNCKMAEEWWQPVAEEIYNMSIKYPNLDIELICAVITHETGTTWNPECISPAGAIGLMQIMPATGAYLAREENLEGYHTGFLFNPIYNIRLGCRYLAALVQAYSLDAGLAAYNGGMQLAERWIQNGRAEGILYQETANYVPAILTLYGKYQQLSPVQTGKQEYK